MSVHLCAAWGETSLINTVWDLKNHKEASSPWKETAPANKTNYKRPWDGGDSNLGSRDEEEAGCQQKALKRGLAIGELDALQVEHRLRVGQDERVQSQNFEHLGIKIKLLFM